PVNDNDPQIHELTQRGTIGRTSFWAFVQGFLYPQTFHSLVRRYDEVHQTTDPWRLLEPSRVLPAYPDPISPSSSSQLARASLSLRGRRSSCQTPGLATLRMDGGGCLACRGTRLRSG